MRRAQLPSESKRTTQTEEENLTDNADQYGKRNPGKCSIGPPFSAVEIRQSDESERARQCVQAMADGRGRVLAVSASERAPWSLQRCLVASRSAGGARA